MSSSNLTFIHRFGPYEEIFFLEVDFDMRYPGGAVNKHPILNVFGKELHFFSTDLFNFLPGAFTDVKTHMV